MNGRTWIGAGFSLLAVLIAIPAPAIGQGDLSQWRLSPAPDFEIGQHDVELHRVSAAVMLPGGEVAIADGGNRRILVLSGRGALVREIGGQGAGPGEFEALTTLAAAHDTLVVYDAQLARVTLFLPDGTLIDVVRLPDHAGRPVHLRSMLSSREYIVTTSVLNDVTRRGLYVDTVQVLVVDSQTDQIRIRPLALYASNYTYGYLQAGGPWTGYSAPFLGRALFTGSAGQLVVVPLRGPTVDVFDRDVQEGSRPRRIALPAAERPFDAAMIAVFRDSVLERAAAVRGRFPGAEERIRDVYSDDFPAPAAGPLFHVAVPVADQIWVQAFPLPGDRETQWYVVEPSTARLLARLTLPTDLTVLGGSDHLVLVLRRDELDVEHVAGYSISR